MLFNVVVDNVIRTWLAMTVEDQMVDHERLEETVGKCLGIFYADDGMVGSRDPDWMQHSMNVLVGLIQRYGLVSNINKSRAMMCQPVILRSGMSKEDKALKCTGVGDSY